MAMILQAVNLGQYPREYSGSPLVDSWPLSGMFKVTVPSLKLEIRLHAHQGGKGSYWGGHRGAQPSQLPKTGCTGESTLWATGPEEDMVPKLFLRSSDWLMCSELGYFVCSLISGLNSNAATISFILWSWVYIHVDGARQFINNLYHTC